MSISTPVPTETRSSLSLTPEAEQQILQNIPKNPELGAQLKAVPILAQLTDDERAIVGGAFQERVYADAANIIKEGEPGQEFYILKEGEAIVSVLDTETKKQKEIARLKTNDYFGEKALLSDGPRGASITAVGQCIVLYIDRDKFTALFGSKLKIQFAKRNAISAETSAMPQRIHESLNAQRDKGESIERLISKALKSNIVFNNIDKEQEQQIIKEMWRKEVKAGVMIIRQGELGDNFYVVEKGQFDIFIAKKGAPGYGSRVAVRGKGQSFGELALMWNAPRAATVIAATDSIVWAIDRFSFRRILANVSSNKLKEYSDFLQKVPALNVLARYEREKISEALEEVEFPANHIIVKQGDEGDTFYIIREGEVTVTRHETLDSPDVVVNRYKDGDFFGERALIKGEPRAATVTTTTPTRCLVLDRQAFSLLLGPLEDIMHKRINSFTSSPMLLPEEEKKKDQQEIKIQDLVTIGTLGKGSFGHVRLVRHKDTGKTYALKGVGKAMVVQLGQQEHIINEKKTMAMLDHPFIIRLHASFKDKNYLYFLLEPSLGGELFRVLRARVSFKNDVARFYAASVVLAFEYMHDKDIIYRDLKPENLLLDSKGFLKITDFGFAKVVKNRTWTLCGTPDYLAPEVVSGQGHGKGVDWWTLGILIFEMLASYPPFYDEDPMKTYGKIMRGDVKFPINFSLEVIDLLKGLLNVKPTKRLGVVKGGSKNIKAHPWFKGFDWDALFNMTMVPPIIPPVKSETDLSNFDIYDDNDLHLEYEDDGSNWDSEF